MKKIFIVYGHYNEKSFNSAIRDRFIETVKNNGHEIDIVDLYKEKFDPVFSGEEPDNQTLDHRKRIENSDVIVLIAPIGNLKGKKAVVFCTYGSPQFAVRTFFLNMPTKRLRRGVFNICGITDVIYRRYFAVPFVGDKKRDKFLDDVQKTANCI